GSKRADFSHFQVACEKLGIQLLFANSPEAKGRIERSFRTIQDRLIPELRSSGITSMDEANEYLKSEFLTKYWNDKKIVKPRVDDSAYEPLDPWLNLDEILCLIEDRKIGSDHTASYQGQRYIIKPPVGSLAGLVASFKVNIEGELKVSVMEQEVEIRAVSTRQYKVLDKINSDKKLQLLHPDIDIPMALLISDLWSSVWNHKVTGKPLKLSKRAIRVLGKAS
ncbi:MAG: hypothetical protein KDD50_16180, partial [Bdellovibrionales bacterium]|nr:hypothetical protein [Bdellovibrionales bacterium]